MNMATRLAPPASRRISACLPNRFKGRGPSVTCTNLQQGAGT